MAERFGRYWLHEKIGHGGMAEIFRATIGPDPQTYAFDLALKRLHSHLENDQSQVDMFLTEADIAKFLRHPNLVRVYEAGLQAGRAYITMEYVWGHDLSRLITVLAGRRLRFPSDLAVYTALQLLRALDYVHRARSPGGVSMELVHRDVTPANVYVTLFGEVKLGDFGVARISFLESDETGLLKGKAAYMPPEVLAGDPVGQGVDLWGIAVILYEMLTTRRVYEGVTEDDLMTGVEPPAIPPVEKVNPDVDPKLARIVNRALSSRTKKRPVDALQFYQQLKLYLRDTSIVSDAQAMSRFVAEVMGSSPSKKQGAVDDSKFGLPEYKVPIGTSPTQRFEQRHRQRARARPLIAIGALMVIAAIAFGVYRFAGRVGPVEPAGDPVTEATAPEEGATDATPTEATADEPVDFDLDGLDAEGIEVGDQGIGDIRDPAARLRALVHRGRVQLKRGRAESSLAAYRAASELKPEHIAARLGQASALLALGQHEEAERQVNMVLERKPKYAAAFVVLGDIAVARGDAAQARWAYERCLKVAPEDSRAARSAKKALSKL